MPTKLDEILASVVIITAFIVGAYNFSAGNFNRVLTLEKKVDYIMKDNEKMVGKVKFLYIKLYGEDIGTELMTWQK